MDHTQKLGKHSETANAKVGGGENKDLLLELALKAKQLDAEKNKSLEYLETIKQLNVSLKYEQNKSAELERKIAIQDAKAKELADILDNISSIAAGV